MQEEPGFRRTAKDAGILEEGPEDRTDTRVFEVGEPGVQGSYIAVLLFQSFFPQ